jgi:ankyrin repeat protein
MSQDEFAEKPAYWEPAAGERGMTELHYAAYCNDPAAVRDELRQGTPVDIRDNNGWTPLFWSIDMAEAWGDPRQVVSILLNAGASATAVDNSGRTVLMIACGRNNVEILEQLIDAGADIRARSERSTPLHEAAASHFLEGIQRLLALGADSREKNGQGYTAEQLAELCGWDDCVAILRAARHAT